MRPAAKAHSDDDTNRAGGPRTITMNSLIEYWRSTWQQAQPGRPESGIGPSETELRAFASRRERFRDRVFVCGLAPRPLRRE